MLKPPFKLAASLSPVAESIGAAEYIAGRCCGSHGRKSIDDGEPTVGNVPGRLLDLDVHLHCSVIGTCLSTAELRKLMARFLFVRDSSDLEVHHEAVSHASRGGPITKALHKLLDQRHDAVVQRFSRAHDAASLAALWEEALRQGEVPGAYWAVLTHRNVTSDLRQKVFGDVHMLSHLVGAANHADIRRLVALERDNANLREKLDRQQTRTKESIEERDRKILQLRDELGDARLALQATRSLETVCAGEIADTGRAADQVALHTQRRERAEQAADIAAAETHRLRSELEHLDRQARALSRELAVAETQLRELCCTESPPRQSLSKHLHGKRILYVGGRPSATPAIRELVIRHGGEFQRHDGFEDRKGMLASGVSWAELVVFPVDCIDHDSAINLKRLCARQQASYLVLRSASVASFAAALASPEPDDDSPPGREVPPICLKHG
jgi:hypothetical protein